MKAVKTALVVALCAAFGTTGLAIAQTDAPPPTKVDKSKYSPYPKQTFPNRVYFGDTHLHTALSTDAGMLGTTLGPEEAYRFARGEAMTSNTGLLVRRVDEGGADPHRSVEGPDGARADDVGEGDRGR